MALLIGDISFLHDLSALAAAHHVRVPMALVVVQNQGGRIFEMLPLVPSSFPMRSLRAMKRPCWSTNPC